MFTGGVVESEHDEAWVAELHERDWRALHDQLRDKAQQRLMLEAEESDLLLLAEECRLFARLGYVSMAEYMERELFYARHAANERLRVAHELLALPVLRDRYRAGELCFSAVRELTRVATPQTERAFADAAAGTTSRDVQRLVAGKRRGDDPETPPDPALIRHRISFEVDAETYAMWRRTRTALDDERGDRLDDDLWIQTLCRRAVESAVVEPPVASDTVEREASEATGNETSPRGARAKPAPRPAVQLAVTTCRHCQRAWASAGGIEAPLTEAQLGRARCDAIHVGDLDRDESTRARSEIPEPTRRKVFIRDLHACTVPGCRSTRNLDVHHIIPQADGGGHALWNLTVLCHAHHHHLHDGKLSIRGRAPVLEVAWRHDEGDEEAWSRVGPRAVDDGRPRRSEMGRC